MRDMQSPASVAIRRKILTAYARAESHFTSIGSARALAVIQLRKASVWVLEAISPIYPPSADSETKKVENERLKSVRDALAATIQLLQRAMDLFSSCGDAQGHDLAAVCLLLMNADSADDADTVGVPRIISERLGNEGNAVLALHLSLLAGRIGQRFRYLCGRPSAALAGFECSRRLARLWYKHINDAMKIILQGILDPAGGTASEGSVAIHVEDPQRPLYLIALLTLVVDTFLEHESLFDDPTEVSRLIEITIFWKRIEAAAAAIPDLMARVRSWSDQSRMRVDFLRALITHRRFRCSDLKKAASVTKSYFLKPEHCRIADLLSVSYIVQLATRVGDGKRAAIGLVGARSDVLLQHIRPSIPYSAFCNKLEVQQLALISAELVLQSCIQAESWPRAERAIQRIEQLSPGYFDLLSAFSRLWFWQRSLYVGLVYEGRGNTAKAAQYIFGSMVVWRTISGWSYGPEDRLNAANHPDASLLIDAVVRMLLRHPNDMSAVLDHPHSLLFSEAVNSSQEPCEEDKNAEKGGVGLSPDELKELESLQQELPTLESRLVGLGGQDRHTNWESLKQNTEELGDPWFLHKTLALIPHDVLVVYLMSSQQGLTSFAIAHGSILHAHRNDSAKGVWVTYLVAHFMQDIKSCDKEPNRRLNKLLSALFLQPFERYKRDKQHIIFVPSGDITSLPFGALLYQDDYLISTKCISQVLTLFLLVKLYLKSATTDFGESIQGDGLVFIDRPIMTPRQNLQNLQKGNERNLPWAPLEAATIASMLHVGPPAKSSEDFGREAFAKLLGTATVLHLATHGNIDWLNPLKSGLSLGERFLLSDLAAKRTNLRLVTLSACWTGAGVTQFDGGLLGFSHALLATGALNFVGALWSLTDYVAAIFMVLFYSTLMAAPEPISVAAMFQTATKILMRMSTKNCTDLLKNVEAVWDRIGKNTLPASFLKRSPIDQAKLAREDLENSCSAPKLSHPFYWASFVLIDNADYKLYIDAPKQLKDTAMALRLGTMATRRSDETN
ncbi:hypothetical protein G7Z17_g5682 [Cylindrodendrum hubeiense]|uniref:CHAT domain-containing protein n=1 Tax=Cylindrodendrum hubeiense TaxID=595255 RepID=A0A9P5HCG9_9HYPO|nr:hypothetical protein G7Z17_g5682 [Cylindrodendrum hubeiense]